MRRIAAVLLSLCAALMLAACSDKEKSTSVPPAEQTPVQSSKPAENVSALPVDVPEDYIAVFYGEKNDYDVVLYISKGEKGYDYHMESTPQTSAAGQGQMIAAGQGVKTKDRLFEIIEKHGATAYAMRNGDEKKYTIEEMKNIIE